MPIRPASSTCSALTKPWPSPPSMCDAGTRQSSKTTSLVSLARIPSLSSFLPAFIPGVPRSMMKAAIPYCHRDEDVTDAAVRCKRLGSVEHPPVAGLHGGCAEAGRVASRARLGQPPRADLLAPGQRNQVLVLLCLGAEHRDMGRAQAVVRRDRERDARI